MATATRPIFIPDPNSPSLVKEISIQFEWFLGMARTQKQKNIQSFHVAAKKNGFTNILEISTYSEQVIGTKLSALNLLYMTLNSSGTVEELYQKSKILSENNKNSSAEKNINIKGSKPIGFLFENFNDWFLDPQNPSSCFYDWLYINAIQQDQNTSLAKEIFKFDAFTDIAYNPKKSLSTQARSAALYVALKKMKKIEQTKNPDQFIKLLKTYEYMREPKNLFTQKFT
jgi:hypothetical protein